MVLARHASGLDADVRALVSQVHPVFMLPPLASSWFGAVIAADAVLTLEGVRLDVGAVHALATFFGVYTAHVKDGYVDFYRRGEDADHPMTPYGCRVALVGATAGFALCVVALWQALGPGAALITLPGWALGYFHAPQLDTNPVTATVGYPLGIALALLGGYYVQTEALSETVVAFAAVFVVILAGVKIVDDAQDYDFDRDIGKRTVAVVLDRERARRAADGLFLLGAVMVLWGTVDGWFPVSSPVAVLAFGVVALFARRAPPEVATPLLVRGAYVLLAVLVVAVAFRPLAGVSLPSIAALGPYTYLATEVVFGAVAAGLLVHAGAARQALRTVAVLYPVAYLWDWYTLEVGVFAIPMRTGVELFAIPLEEHVFMVVVPALVVGVHETLRSLGSSGDGSSDRAGE